MLLWSPSGYRGGAGCSGRSPRVVIAKIIVLMVLIMLAIFVGCLVWRAFLWMDH
jgi:hypothetical protein